MNCPSCGSRDTFWESVLKGWSHWVCRTRTYHISKARIAQLTVSQRWLAKACAYRYGIKYKIVD